MYHMPCYGRSGVARVATVGNHTTTVVLVLRLGGVAVTVTVYIHPNRCNIRTTSLAPIGL